jgi:hypothetical protein
MLVCDFKNAQKTSDKITYDIAQIENTNQGKNADFTNIQVLHIHFARLDLHVSSNIILIGFIS